MIGMTTPWLIAASLTYALRCGRPLICSINVCMPATTFDKGK